ncbi:amino acid permease [Maioricimonas sp. JC845]|uniref:APC family permease n=1 Tax=Maioricimonas sp. JC845 TaxID=3232138 RepID=UPI0034591624
MSDTEQMPPTAGRLSPFDAGSIIVGIVVGTAIFKAPPFVFSNVPGPVSGLLVWLAGGVLSLIGALCYSELATTYPRLGGEYVYLTRAYGSWLGFLFGWTQLTAILTGSVGTMAFVFGDYAQHIAGLAGIPVAASAVFSVVLLTAVNLRGIVVGKTVQNILSIAKVGGLVAILLAAMAAGIPEEGISSTGGEGRGAISLGLAFVFVLYAYGGWSDAAFIAAEVRDLNRNIPRALLIGVGAITLLYLAVNGAYLLVLGYEGLCNSGAPAADVLERVLGKTAAGVVSVLVMISALGAINGMLYAGSRVFATLGEDHRCMGWLGKWNDRDVPATAFLALAVLSVGLILAVGTEAGRKLVDVLLGLVGIAPMPWEQYGGGFDTLVSAMAPVFWVFFLLSGLSLMVLRWQDGERPRPFRVPLYPFTPIVFCLTSGYMLYSSLMYARQLALFGLLPVLVGLALYVGQSVWGGGRVDG